MILTPPFRSLIAQAHNGSGKTTCFTLGMLGRVDTQTQAPQVRAGDGLHPAVASNGGSPAGHLTAGGRPPACPLCVCLHLPPRPQALCVCPTRELVVQNQMVLERMGKFTGEPWGRWGCQVVRGAGLQLVPLGMGHRVAPHLGRGTSADGLSKCA